MPLYLRVPLNCPPVSGSQEGILQSLQFEHSHSPVPERTPGQGSPFLKPLFPHLPTAQPPEAAKIGLVASATNATLS